MFKRKDDVKTFIVVICICAICVVAVLLLNIKSNYDKLETVNEYEVFFTNVSYINDYVSKIASNDNNAVYGLLDEKYKADNGITLLNVIEKSDDYSAQTSFSGSNMSFVKVNDNFVYYVNGQIYENKYDGQRELMDDDYSIIIVIDTGNSTYSLYPVEDDYETVINKIKKINISSNGHNLVQQTIDISKEQVCIMYLSDFTNNIFDNIDVTYNLLSDDMKKIYVNKTVYENYINDNMSLITSSANRCKLEEIDDKRVYTVIDDNENTYVFTEDSIMNYKVDFYLKESE